MRKGVYISIEDHELVARRVVAEHINIRVMVDSEGVSCRVEKWDEARILSNILKNLGTMGNT